MAVVVTKDFLDGAPWDEAKAVTSFTANSNDPNVTSTRNGLKTSGVYEDEEIYTTVLRERQRGARNLTELSNDECRASFGSDNLQSPYLNVLIIANQTSDDSFLTGEMHFPEWGANGAPWFRNDVLQYGYYPRILPARNRRTPD